ncbi:MAG TPA: PAS domain S-box protein [Acetobacteraceae bacterium]
MSEATRQPSTNLPGQAGSATEGQRPGADGFRVHGVRALGAVVTLLGLIALLGWALAPSWLPASALPIMQPLSGVAFTLTGVALILAPTVPALATLPALIALLIAAQDLLLAEFGVRFGASQRLFAGSRIAGNLSHYAIPGRMAPLTAVGLTLFAAALMLFLLGRGKSWTARAVQVLATVGLLLSAVTLTNHVFAVMAPQFVHSYSDTMVLAAFGLLLLFVGVLVLTQDSFWLRPLLDSGEAAILARRLVPAVILGPLLVDWLTLQGAQIGLYSASFGPALGTVLNAALLSGIVLRATTRLADATRNRAELLATLDLSPTLARDPDGTIRYWSAGCERLYDIPAVEAVGRRTHDLLRTEFPRPLPEIEASLERHGEWRGELRHHTPGGRAINVSSHWTLRRDARGRPLAVAEAGTDITALYMAREATARAEAEFRASFEHSAVGRLQAEPLTGRILRVNGAFARTLGHADPAAMDGMGFWELIHPDHRDGDRAAFVPLLRGDAEEFVRETRQLRQDGSAMWVRVCATLLRDRVSGAPLRLLADVEDISARRAAEQELHDVAERFRRMFEDNPIGIAVSDVEAGRLSAANPAFCRMLEYTPDELIGRTRNDITHPDDRLIGEEIRHGSTLQSYEKRFVTKSGRTVLARVRVARLDLPGDEHEVLLGMIEDITALRETEANLRHSQRLESVGRLTGGIAHDFNNMLGVIIGNVEVLQDAVQDDPMGKELASVILNTAVSGADLTRRLLAFARRQPLQPVVFDLNAVVADQVRLQQRTLGERVRVVTALAPGLRRVLADPSQVGDALLNLALNARDAMPNGGRLSIETANVRFTADDKGAAPGDYVMLLVADNGLGMPPEVLDQATTPFFTTKPPGTGSGLGLSMIYGYARQSGGQLLIDSTLGVGTTVRLYLPAAAEDDAVVAKPPPGDLPRGREKVLLVDDNPEMRNVAAHHLRSLGYHVAVADGAAAALSMLRSGEHFDLLFTDLVMPGVMTGEELATEAKVLQPDMSVLLTTGYGGARNGLGTVDDDPPGPLLRKPYRRRELAEMVREALRPR